METYSQVNTDPTCEKRRRMMQKYQDDSHNKIFGTAEDTISAVNHQPAPVSASTHVIASVVATTPQFNSTISQDLEIDFYEAEDVPEEESFLKYSFCF